jgi:hypothetical protein
MYILQTSRFVNKFVSFLGTSLPKLYGPSNLKYLKLIGLDKYFCFSGQLGTQNYFIGNECVFHQLFQLLRFFFCVFILRVSSWRLIIWMK